MFDFKKKYGHCDLPYKNQFMPLIKWIRLQKNFHKKGNLSIERLKLLQNLGVIPDINGLTDWDKCYQELIRFKNKFGHCDVPPSYKSAINLYHWVKINLQAYKQKRLSADKRNRLLSIEFIPEYKEKKWQAGYQKLLDYRQRHGHSYVPRIYPEDRFLGNWVQHQRKAYRTGKLPISRIQALNDVNFIWEPTEITHREWEEKWDAKFKSLVNFKFKHGHFNLTHNDYALMMWVNIQRWKYKENKLDKVKIKRLNEIDFIWSKRDYQWELYFQQLVSFRQKYGHCKVFNPQYKSLYLWLSHQRLLFKSKRLSSTRANRLMLLDKDWIVNKSTWNMYYQQLITFKKKFGHCNVSINFTENKKLSQWVSLMRSKYKRGLLPGNKLKKLEELGIMDNYPTKWEKKYQELINFKKEFGHLDVDRLQNKPLAVWIYKQRADYKYGKLSEEKINLLMSIGFNF